VFLIALGLAALVGSGGRSTRKPPRLTGRPFAVGLLTNLTNPKALLFFLSVLPQLLSSSDAPAVPTALALAVIPVASSLVGLGARLRRLPRAAPAPARPAHPGAGDGHGAGRPRRRVALER
jgi:threonine/homoserine/homoserine lactone efflux protein